MPDLIDTNVDTAKVETVISTVSSSPDVVELKNADALSMPAKVEDVEKPAALPSFFVDPTEKIKIELDILCDKDTGKIISITTKGLLGDLSEFKKQFSYFCESFDFTLPTYEDMISYRQKSSNYRLDANKLIIDSNNMRACYIAWHLKSWSLRDKNGKAIVLNTTKTGHLDEESQKAVYSVNPALMEAVMDSFEKVLLK